MPKRKDWWIIAIALLMALGLFVLTRSGIRLKTPGGDDPMRVLTEISGSNQPATQPQATQEAPIAYLVVSVGNTRYKPLPIYREAEYRLHQANGRDNVLHVTRDSVYMKEANCDNQSCINQGTVTLNNAETRVLGNMIICLPNQVVLELVTPQEAGEQKP